MCNLKKQFGVFILLNLFIILVAFAALMFIIPSKITSGGFMSLALLIHHFLGSSYRAGFNVGVLAFLLNIPLLIYSYIYFRKDYFYKSCYGTLALPLFVSVIDKILEVSNIQIIEFNPYFSVAIGSIMYGIGIGGVMVLGGSTGGTDIVAKIINQYFGKIPIGRAIIISNTIILLLSLLIFGAKRAILSAIVILINGNLIDLVTKNLKINKEV